MLQLVNKALIVHYVYTYYPWAQRNITTKNKNYACELTPSTDSAYLLITDSSVTSKGGTWKAPSIDYEAIDMKASKKQQYSTWRKGPSNRLYLSLSMRRGECNQTTT